MTPLATVTDVETRLGRSLTTAESTKVDPGLLEEASVKALAYMGYAEDFYDGSTVPTTVTIVVSRMVARVIEQATSGIVPGTQQAGQTAGIFSQQTTFVAGSSNGSPWLTRSDKSDLDSARGANKAFSVDTAPTALSIHAETCGLYFGATFCTCGADIAGYPIFGV